jgi:UDP-N-acetylglucosamine 2-epimerase (non-hydrolysing)
MKIAAVVGTRPEVIKLAPVVAELQRRPNAETMLVASGQHREMLDQMLELFALEPDVDLGVMQPKQQLGELTAELVRGLAGTIADLEPDWVLVQGDTTTTLCGALAAFYAGTPVAHVEAGLRSGDNRAPFPEEGNRRLVSPLATLHFCPTRQSALNLQAEAVTPDRVHVTGNTVIDALLWAVERARELPPAIRRTRPRRVLLTVHRRENHGEALREVCRAVRGLAERGDVEIVFPVHRSPAVREIAVPELAGVAGVVLTDPLDYLELVQVLDTCDLVLTDSGGLQEEAPTLGKPVLVLRETTERPEAVDAGVARLVGTNASVVEHAAARLLDDPAAHAAMAHPANPFGDGRASRRIADALAASHPLVLAA